MAEVAHKTVERSREPQRKAAEPAQAAEGSVQFAADPRALTAAGGATDDTTARHAATLRDPRLRDAGPLQRARMIQQLQRGYGNGHVGRVLARVQVQLGADAPLRRRESGSENTAEDRLPTEAEKAAALKAAAAAEQVATHTESKGADQAGQVKSAKATDQAAGQTAKQKASAANSAAKSTIQAGKGEKRSVGGAGKAKHTSGGIGLAQESTSQPAADKAPASSAEDPTFQSVVGKVKNVGAKQKAHPSAQSKAAGAQAAAESPTSELSSKAQANQVVKMQQAEAPPFDAVGFKAKLMEKIAATAPKNAQEADSFKESDKLGGVKGEMQGSVTQEQAKSQGPIEQQTAAEPDASGVAPKPVTPLAPAEPGAPPTLVGAEGAAPKPKTAAEVEAPLKENTKQVDQQMTSADVSEEQLKESNEPEFQGALEAKDQAQTQAQAGPQEYRQAEQAQLNAAEGEAATTAEGQTQTMHAERAGLLQQVGGKQTQTKSKDEQERAKVGADIQNIYNETKANVETQLNGLDAKVNQAFDEGATAAKKTFEDFVEAKMTAFKEDRYGGWFGWARWAKDKIAGMPSEVNTFYSEGRSKYLGQMDAVIDRVVTIVGATITEAKAEIARGKQRIAEYVAKLPANLKQVGQESADGIQSQFDSLEESVNNKQGELIDSMAKKYNENLQAIDARIDELKAANKGLVDKALDAVVGVIKTIMQLKDMLLGVLARAASVIGTIIKHPIQFLSNLISGVKQGLMNFVSNIGTHLQKGLMTWLFGELAAGGIELPKSFDIKGILTLIMQILGLTWEAIKAQAEKMLGPKVVSVLIGAFDIFMIIKDQGIGGLWEYIKDKVGNLADMVIDGIKDLVKSQVIEAGIQWLLGILGGPAGAFIKAAKAIIDIVMWFVNNGSRVMALVNSVLDSVTAIASGSLGEAAAYIEKSLANAVPVMIGFLASLLGLGNLSQKIKGVIEKVQAPVKQAIGWVLGKAKSFASKIGGGLKKLGGKGGIDWAKGKTKQGVAWAKSKVKGLFKPEPVGKNIGFNAAGQGHHLWINVQGGKAEVMVASRPDTANNNLSLLEAQKGKLPADKQGTAAPLFSQGRTQAASLRTAADQVVEANRTKNPDIHDFNDKLVQAEKELMTTFRQLFDLYSGIPDVEHPFKISDESKQGPPQGITEEKFAQLSAQMQATAGHFGSDIRAHGSRAAFMAREGGVKPSDIDIAIRVPPDRFLEVIQQRFKTPNPGSNKEKTMATAIEFGKIQTGELGLSGFRGSLEALLGIPVQISLIRQGSMFDQGPWIKL